ncbi:MAG: hypothetical protein GDA49_08345 [Rhodospirillales bacterium]|nr:hypothetical protein [Rhodospirillales bacterium]
MGTLGTVLLRHWLDRAILTAMIGSYFPVSHIWAAAVLAATAATALSEL